MQNENQPLSPNQPALPPVQPFPVYEDIVNETRSEMSKVIEIAKLKPTGENIDQVAFKSRQLRDAGEKFIDEELLQAQPQFNAEQAGIIKQNFMKAHKFALPEKDNRLPNYWGLDSTSDFLKGVFNSAASIYDGVVAATIPLVSGAFDDGSNGQVKQGADGNWKKDPMSPDLKKIKADSLAQSQYDEVYGENATPKFEYADPEGVAVLAGESIGSLAPMALAAVPVVGVPLMFSVYGGSTYGSTIVNAREEEKNRYQAAKDIGVDYESIPESTLQARALIDAGIEVGVEMVGFKIFKKIWGIGRAGRAATPAVSSATRSVAEASTRGVTGTAKKFGLSVLEEATEEGVTQGGQDVVGKATGEKAYFDNWDMAETYGRAVGGGAIGGGGAGTVVGGYQAFRPANENEKEITKRLVLSVIDQNKANTPVATPDLKVQLVVGTDAFNAAIAETQDAANPLQGFVVAREDFKDISQSAMENAKRAGLKIELFGTHAVVYNDTMTSKEDIDELNASVELHQLEGRSRGYVPLDGARGAVVVRSADGVIVRAIPYNTNKELGLAREKADDMQITIPSVTIEEVTGTETIDRERKASVAERAPFHNSQVVSEYVPHLGEDPRALGQVVGAIAADTFKMADEVSQDARIAGADVTAVPTTTELTAAEQTESEKKVVADARKSGVAVVWVNSKVDITDNKTGEKSVRQGSFEALSKFQTLPKTVVLVREGDGKLSGDSALNTQLVVWHELLHEFSSKNGTAAEAILALSPKETAGAYVDYFSRMNRGRFDLADVKLLLDIASAQGVTPEKGGKIQTPDGEIVIPKAEEAMAQQAQTQLIRSGTAGRLSNMGSPSWRAGQLANNIATRFGFNGKTAKAVQSIVMQRMAGVDANRVQVASALLAEGKAKRDSIVRESEEMKAKEAATKLEASNKVAAEAEAVALNTAKSDALNVKPIEPAKKMQPKIRAEMDAIEKDIDAKDLENARIRDELVALEKQGRRTGDFGNQAQLSQQRNELAAQTREQEGRLAYLSSLDDAEQLDEISKGQNQNFAVPNVNDAADDESMTYAQRLARATLVGRERQSITPEGSLFNNSDPNASVRLENRRDFPVSLSQTARRGLDPKKLDALIKQVQELNFTEAEIEAAVIREPVKKDSPVGTLGRIYGRDDASLTPINAAMQKFQRAVAFGVEGILWYERSAQKFLDLFDNNLVLAKMFATAVAGTSANNDVRANQTASQKVWDQFTADVQLAGFHTKAQEDKVIKFLNEGIGWKGIKTMTFLSNITDALEEEHAKRTGKPAPKPSTRSTIDLWMTRIFFPTKQNPSAVEYKMGENFVRLLTSKLSYDGVPLIERQVQAASWVGQKGESIYEGKVAKWNEKNVGQSMDESTRQQLHDDAYDQALTDYHDTSMRGGVPWTPTKTAVTNRSLAQRKTMAQDSRTNMKVFAEVAPHPKSVFGIISEKWKSASRYALREAALRSHFVDKTHKLLGLKSAVRYTRGMGLYQGQLNHNLTISLVSTPENPLTDLQLAEESELLARTLQYETYQEVNPLHKANFAARKVNGSGSGFQMNFKEELKPKHFEILKDIFIKHFGEGAGFSLMTGYQTLQCADFSSWGDAVKEKQWRKSSERAIIDIEKSDVLRPLIQPQRKRNDPRGTKGTVSHARYATETLGVNGYHEHDWSADAGGVSLGTWITSHARTRGSPNLQAGIDDLRSEFKSLVKKVAKNSWERDPNWTEEIDSLQAAVTAAPNAKEKDKATARLAKRQLSIDTFDDRKTVAYEADVKTAEAAVVKAKAKVSEKKMLATTSNTAESKDAVKEAQKGLTAAQNSLIKEQEKLDEWNKEKPPTPVPPTTPTTPTTPTDAAPTDAAPTDASPEDTTTPDTGMDDMTASVRTATPETLRMGTSSKSAVVLGNDEVTPDSPLLKASNFKDVLLAGYKKRIERDGSGPDYVRMQLLEQERNLDKEIRIPLYGEVVASNGDVYELTVLNKIETSSGETKLTTDFTINNEFDTEEDEDPRPMDVVSKTYATVLHAMKLVANANKPDYISFTANTNKKNRLYNRLAASFAKEIGYQVLSQEDRFLVSPLLNRGSSGTLLQSKVSREKLVGNIRDVARNSIRDATAEQANPMRRMTVDEAMDELATAPNQEQRIKMDALRERGLRQADSLDFLADASVRTATPETLRMSLRMEGISERASFALGEDEVTPDSPLLKASNLKDVVLAEFKQTLERDGGDSNYVRTQLAEKDAQLSRDIAIPLYATIEGADGKEFGLLITNTISGINMRQNSSLPLQENETSMNTDFSIENSYDQERDGISRDMVNKTFATVLHAMKLVANANKPDFIYFNGNTNAKHKLYNRLAASFAEEVGYQVLSKDDPLLIGRRFRGTVLQSKESRATTIDNTRDPIRNSIRDATAEQADDIGVDASVRTGVRGAKDKFLGNMVDRYNELAREQRVAESTGGYKLTSAQDPYLSVRLLTGRLGALQKSAQDRQQKMIDKLGQDGINPEQLGEFMYMQHAAERNAYIASKTGGAKDGGSGITNAEVMKYFANLNSSPTGNPVLFATLMKNADSWRALLKESLKAKLDAGLIKQDAYDAMTTTYKRYVPLRDMEGEYEQEQDQVGSRGMSSVGRGTPRTGLGRGSEAQNIVPQIQFSVLDTVKRVEKLKVGNKFLQFVYEANGQKLDGTLGRISRSYSGWENDPMNFGVFADSDLRLSPEAKAFAGGKPTAEQRRGMFEKGDLVVIRMINPELAKSMTSTTASGDLGLLDSAMEVVGRTWRLMTTGVLAPVFAVTNIARDIGGALPHTTAVQGMGVAARTAANIPLSLARVYRDNFLGNPTGIYKQFIEDGGDQMYWQPNSMDIAVDSIEKMWKKRKDGERLGRRDYERLMHSWYTGLFAASEKASRLATYKAMIDGGQSREQAALWARNVTVDFAKKGHVGQQMNRWWIYSNAGIQGSANMAALATKKGGAAVIATTFAAGFASALFNRWHRDDEDEGNINPWDLVSDYDKASKFVFMKEDGVMVTIPAPYGFNVPYYAGVVAADTLFGPKRDETGAIPSVVERIGVAAINSYLPIGGSGTSQSLTSALAPTIIKPFVELQFNEDYRGAAIYPKENPFDKGTKKPDALESWDSTGAEWKTAAEWLHEKTGGNEVESGGFDVHPETLRFLSGYAFSGTGRLLGQVANFAAGESTAIGLPAVSSFMKETPSSSDIRKQYEYLRNKAAQANDLINEAKSSRDPNTLVNQQNRYPWQFELASQVKASEKKLKQISGWIKDAQTSEEKKKYREAASRVMQEINEYGFDVGAPMK